MATYLTLNSRFTPYTYEQALKPYQDRQKAYEEKAAEVMAILDQTATWEGLLDPEKDKQIYDKLQEFNSKVEAASEQLGRGNLSDVTKSDINALKQEYTKSFTPILTKYTDWKEKAQKQADLINQARARGEDIYATKYLPGMSVTQMMSDDFTYDLVNMTKSYAELAALGQADGTNDIYYNNFKDKQGNPKYGAKAPKTEDQILKDILSYIPTSLSDTDKQEVIRKATEAYRVGYADAQSPENIARIRLQGRQQSVAESNSYRSQTAANMENLLNNATLNMYAPGVRISKDGNSFIDSETGEIIPQSEWENKGINRYLTSATNPHPGDGNPTNGLYKDNIGYYEVVNGKRVYYSNNTKKAKLPMDGTKVYVEENTWQDYETNKLYYKDPETNIQHEIINNDRVTQLQEETGRGHVQKTGIQRINSFINDYAGIGRLSNGLQTTPDDKSTYIQNIKTLNDNQSLAYLTVESAKQKWPDRIGAINNFLISHGLSQDEVMIIYNKNEANRTVRKGNDFYIVATKIPKQLTDSQGQATKNYIYVNNPAVEEMGITGIIYGQVPAASNQGGDLTEGDNPA